MVKQKITEEEVQRALQEFILGGGLIKKLPSQVTHANQEVSVPYGTPYERVRGDILDAEKPEVPRNNYRK